MVCAMPEESPGTTHVLFRPVPWKGGGKDHMRRVIASGFLFLLCLAQPGSCNATTLNELKIGVRVFDFMVAPPRGKTPLAILYDGQNRASLDDARAIQGWVNSGISSAKAELIASLVDARRLDEAPGFRLAIVAAGSDAVDRQILAYAQKNQALTISSDLACLRAGKCVVGVVGAPRVEVIINRDAASRCGIAFSEAFRMMVREY